MMWLRLAAALKREGFPQDRSSWYYVRSRAFPKWIPAPHSDDGSPDSESIAIPDTDQLIEACEPGRLRLERISSRRWNVLLTRKDKRFKASGMYPNEALARLWRAQNKARNRP